MSAPARRQSSKRTRAAGWGFNVNIRGSLFLAGLLALTTQAQAAVFHPQTYMLANGLQVVIVPGALAPAVTQMVWYKTGSADDPMGHSGLAHYLEHMMFKGTDLMPPGAFSATIAAQGGQDNAFTDYDATAYYVSVAASRLPLVMQMEADRMRHLRVAPEEALPEREVVLSERQQRTGNDPQGLFQEKLRAALFPNQPYGRPVIGWQNEIEVLTPDDLRAYYHTHYAPNNAILVISGDVDPATTLALADATFGRLEPEKMKPRAPASQLVRPSQPRLEMKDARITQPFVLREIATASAITDPQTATALEVLSEVLAGGEVGLLYRHFVLEEQTASAVEVSYDSSSRGPSIFTFAFTPSSKEDLRGLEGTFDTYLQGLARKGLPPSAIAAAQQRLIDSAVFARDRLMAPAQILGGALAISQSVQDVEDWPAHIRAVTPAQVNKAFRALLASPYYVSGLLEPAAPEAKHE